MTKHMTATFCIHKTVECWTGVGRLNIQSSYSYVFFCLLRTHQLNSCYKVSNLMFVVFVFKGVFIFRALKNGRKETRVQKECYPERTSCHWYRLSTSAKSVVVIYCLLFRMFVYIVWKGLWFFVVVVVF